MRQMKMKLNYLADQYGIIVKKRRKKKKMLIKLQLETDNDIEA